MELVPRSMFLTPPGLFGSPNSPTRQTMLLFLLLFFLGCIHDKSTLSDQSIVDIAKKSGIQFWHDNGMTGELYFCETVGPGAAFLDFDLDGNLDLFVAQGHYLESDKPGAARVLPPPDDLLPGGRLYRNEGVDKAGNLQFRDVTESSRIKATGYAMGCSVGDVDGDGYPDLLLTNFGTDQLWVNQEDGTFLEKAQSAGVDDDRWTTSSIFVDLDHDGDEDLYVCSYVDYTFDNHKPCYAESSAIEYCGPNSYSPLPDRLYRNRGDGTFEDMTAQSGIGLKPGAGLGVVSSDLDGDGLIDLYVANDGMANRLWRQVDSFRFEDTALLSGCAVNIDGRPEASMGTDLADFDGDGDEDIFITHLTGETNTLYVNNGNGIFDDYSDRSGLGLPSRKWTGFGTAWFDLQNDGFLDLFVTNGAVKRMEEKVAAGDPYPLSQPDQIFINNGAAGFSPIDTSTAEILLEEAVGRGAAFGDIDNDGDIDIFVTNNSGYAKLLENRVGARNSWVGIDLRRRSGRVPDAARCKIVCDNGVTYHRRSRRGGSYLCSNDPRIVAGLGDFNGSVKIIVDWPGGVSESFEIPELRKYYEILEGTGVTEQ